MRPQGVPNTYVHEATTSSWLPRMPQTSLERQLLSIEDQEFGKTPHGKSSDPFTDKVSLCSGRFEAKLPTARCAQRIAADDVAERGD